MIALFGPVINCYGQAINNSPAERDIFSGPSVITNKEANQKNIAVTNSITVLNKSQVKVDSTMQAIENIPIKYFKQVNKKIDKYTDRMASKTEKTLTKLSHWEIKIHNLLKKASPSTDERLFGPGKMTFAIMLTKLREGKSIVKKGETQYNQYNDKLTTSIKYIESKKTQLDSNYIKPLNKASHKVDQLNEEVANTDAVEKFIKERKKQLITESVKYIGKSKYLTKINKESYYYVETLRNYKEIFSDPGKAENTAKTILGKIPAFKKYSEQNSMLASLFGSPSNTVAANLSGLQTRSSVNSSLQYLLGTGNNNSSQAVLQNIQNAQSSLSQLKDKLGKFSSGNNNDELPDFKPNEQRTKTFLQRIEYGFNYQFSKNNNALPATVDIAVSAGYRFTDKNLVGLGISYKMGFGRIDHIAISHEGIGFRSFIDYKLKGSFFISGGYEMNYNAGFSKASIFNNYDTWKKSGLIGFTKKYRISAKIRGNVQLKYDLLSRNQQPVGSPWVFRFGYSF